MEEQCLQLSYKSTTNLSRTQSEPLLRSYYETNPGSIPCTCCVLGFCTYAIIQTCVESSQSDFYAFSSDCILFLEEKGHNNGSVQGRKGNLRVTMNLLPFASLSCWLCVLGHVISPYDASVASPVERRRPYRPLGAQ